MNITPQIVEASISAGNLKDAENQVEQVLKDHPDSARAHLLKAEVLAKEGHLAESQKEFGQVISFDKTGDTVNSPMYKTLTQEYVVLNSHQEMAGTSWEVIVLILLIILAGVWTVLHHKKRRKEEALEKSLLEEALTGEPIKSSRQKSFSERYEFTPSDFKSPRDKALDKSSVIQPSPAAWTGTIPSYVPPLSVRMPSVGSSVVGGVAGAAIGVLAAETLLNARDKRVKDEESEARRKRLNEERSDFYIDGSPTFNPSLYGTTEVRSSPKSDWNDTPSAVVSSGNSSSASNSSDWITSTPRGSSASSSSSWDNSSYSSSSSDSSSSYSDSSSSSGGSDW